MCHSCMGVAFLACEQPPLPYKWKSGRSPFPIFICRVGGGCTQAIAFHVSVGLNSINRGSLGVCHGIDSSSCLNSTSIVNLMVSTFIRNFLWDKRQCLKFLLYSVEKYFSQHQFTSPHFPFLFGFGTGNGRGLRYLLFV